MAIPTDFLHLLRLYSVRQNSPNVVIPDFADYLDKFARLHLQEAPGLEPFVGISPAETASRLRKLAAEEECGLAVSKDLRNRDMVFVPQFYLDRFRLFYKNILQNPEVPFPAYIELPRAFPRSLIREVSVEANFSEFAEETAEPSSAADCLIKIEFGASVPPLVFPDSLSPQKLLSLALDKIRLFLRKDESRDFICKRMMAVNPGKENAVREFVARFQSSPEKSAEIMQEGGDAYLFYNYLCAFIKQYILKKEEKTAEEISLLQSVDLAEYFNNHYKGKAQKRLQRETALKNLMLFFQKPPYSYTMEEILAFTDSRGVPLLGQYSREDLDGFLQEKTSAGDASLAEILVFRDKNEVRHFVAKEKAEALTVRLCEAARKPVKTSITRMWYDQLYAYSSSAAMRTQNDFEALVENECRKFAPELYALWKAPFMPLLAHESLSGKLGAVSAAGFPVFAHGAVLPLSGLLMLRRQELLTDAKILLPFWYSVPVLSAILAFFRKRRGAKHRRPERTEAAAEAGVSAEEKADAPRNFAKTVADTERAIVPAGSSLEAELASALAQWNLALDAQNRKNQEEDVNSLIRDYVRRIQHTLRSQTFDADRVRNLARTLADAPGLRPVKNREALYVYIQLYILKLVKHTARMH